MTEKNVDWDVKNQNKRYIVFSVLEGCFYHRKQWSQLYVTFHLGGAQWLSGRVLDLRPKGPGFESLPHHCIVVLEQDIFILA